MNLSRLSAFVESSTRMHGTRSRGGFPDSRQSPSASTPYTPTSVQLALNSGRKRTAQACDKCRGRKTKCSGERPVCQRCATRGLICHYSCREQKNKSPPVMPSLEDPMSRSPSSGMTMAPGALPHSSSGGVSPPSRSSSRTMDSPAERSRSHLEDQPHASPYVTQSNPFTSTGSLMRIANRYSPYHDYQAPRSLRGQGRRSTRDLLLSPPDRSFNSLSESCGPPSLEYLSPSSWPHNQELSSDAGHPYAAYSYEDSNTADWDYSPAVGGDALAYPPYSPISPPRILNHGMVPSCFPEEQFGSTDGFLPTSVYDCNIIGPGPSHLG